MRPVCNRIVIAVLDFQRDLGIAVHRSGIAFVQFAPKTVSFNMLTANEFQAGDAVDLI